MWGKPVQVTNKKTAHFWSMSYTHREAMSIVNRRENGWPVPFDMEVVSYDSNTHRSKKCSSLKTYQNCVKTKSSHDDKTNATISFTALGEKGVRTVHTKLIMKLNGKWVN